VERKTGQKGSILFLEHFYFNFGGNSEAAMGGGARSAPFGVLMSPRGQNPLVFL
jgi:hypothetical protein